MEETAIKLATRAERDATGSVRLENGETEGRDPRKMAVAELGQLGHVRMPLLKAIRAKCLDCSHTESEVRKCTAVDCALWPYRMRKNPFNERVANPNAGAALKAWRERQTNGADDDEDGGYGVGAA